MNGSKSHSPVDSTDPVPVTSAAARHQFHSPNLSISQKPPEGKANRRHHLQCCNELRPRNKEPEPILKFNSWLKKVFSRLLYCRLGKTHRTKFRGQLCLPKKFKFTNRSGKTLANVAIHPSKLQCLPWDLEELQVEFLAHI